MKTGIIIGCVLLGVVLLVLLFAYYTYRMAFYSDRKKTHRRYCDLSGEPPEIQTLSNSLVDRIMDMPYEDVNIKSYDGLKLHARYYHNRDGAAVEIQFHGYKSVSRRDLSGAVPEALSQGRNVLLIDHRAHGDSEGRSITFGAKEKYDALSWVNYAVERFGEDVEILLYGISMGGGTVLMASALDLPKNVKGIVADCPFSSAGEIILKVAAEMGFPKKPVHPFIRLGAKLFAGFSLDEASAVDAVGITDIPILIIHGEGDGFVPCEMSRQIHKAGPTTELRTFPKAGHGLCYLYYREEYMKCVTEFYNRIFTEKNQIKENNERNI